MQTGIGIGTEVLGLIQAVPGLGQVATLAKDIVGAFGLQGEQLAYNALITKYYNTPVSQGGGWNPGTPRSRRQMRLRQLRHFQMF